MSFMVLGGQAGSANCPSTCHAADAGAAGLGTAHGSGSATTKCKLYRVVGCGVCGDVHIRVQYARGGIGRCGGRWGEISLTHEQVQWYLDPEFSSDKEAKAAADKVKARKNSAQFQGRVQMSLLS